MKIMNKRAAEVNDFEDIDLPDILDDDAISRRRMSISWAQQVSNNPVRTRKQPPLPFWPDETKEKVWEMKDTESDSEEVESDQSSDSDYNPNSKQVSINQRMPTKRIAKRAIFQNPCIANEKAIDQTSSHLNLVPRSAVRVIAEVELSDDSDYDPSIYHVTGNSDRKYILLDSKAPSKNQRIDTRVSKEITPTTKEKANGKNISSLNLVGLRAFRDQNRTTQREEPKNKKSKQITESIDDYLRKFLDQNK